MKKFIVIAVVLLGLIFGMSKLFRVQIGEAVFKRAVTAQIGGEGDITNGPDGLHVVLVGTGSPLGDPTRMGPSTAVIAGDRVFIVDAGSGSPRNLARFGVPTARIERVLLTHFHSDHIDGLGELLLLRWIGAGATTPVPVYGPTGVEQVVDGLNRAYELDASYRTAHHGAIIAPPSGQGGQPVAFDYTAPVVLLEEDDLKISAFPVIHDPVNAAVGYRFDYKGRSVTLTGDTAYDSKLADYAKGSDILIAEALNTDMVGIMRQAAQDADIENIAKILADIPTYHMTPVDAARMAQAAGTEHLILSHIVPAVPTRYLEAYYLKGTRDSYDGNITLGQDGMVFSLPPSQ